MLFIELERGYLNLNCKILIVDNSIMIINELLLLVLVIWEDFWVLNEKKNIILVKKVLVIYFV